MWVRPRLGALFAITSTFALSACSSQEGERCATNSACAVGQRCEEAVEGEGKVCVACDPAEVPYDGEDNDCDPRTRDFDLDDDDDNWEESAFRPGTDCDDNDPTINVRAAEVCGDGKDNNCDGEVDELRCGDRIAPSVTILRPDSDVLVSGEVEIEVDSTDDTMVVQLALTVDGVPEQTVMAARTTFRLDTTRWPDGPITVRVQATDLADRVGSDDIILNLDNTTAPRVTPLSPVSGASYGGRLELSATAEDAAGVASVQIEVDGASQGTLTSPPFAIDLDTTTLDEGTHTVAFRATDNNGNAELAEVQFLIDRTGPGLDIDITPINGIEVSGTFTVSITATDPAGITVITSTTGRYSADSRQSPLAYPVDTLIAPRIQNGPLDVVVSALDRTIIDGVPTGNLSVETVTVQVENIPPEPVVTLTTPQDGWGVFRSTTILAAVTSPVSNAITNVDFFVDGVLAGSDGTSPYQLVYDFSDHPVGTATVTVRAVDDELYEGEATAVVQIVPPPTFRLSRLVRGLGNLGNNGYTIGDVTGDGVLDAVVCGSETSVVPGILDGSGFRFGAPVRLTGTSANVRLANVDADPALDAIVLTNTTFDVYPNQGTGTFDAPVSTPLGITQPSDLEVADLDGDGDQDLVVGLLGQGGGDIRVFLQDNGTFPAGLTYGTVGTVTDVVLRDVDGDLDLDVALGRSGTAVTSVYRNAGDGSFGAAQDSFTQAAPQTLAVGDVTGDDYPDLVVAVPSQSVFQVLSGSTVTPGTFTVASTTDTLRTPSGLVLGDLDGDLDLDLVVSALAANSVDVFTNDGSGVFTRSRAFAIARDASRPSLVDLDQDSSPEIIVSSTSDNGLAYARNLGGGDYLAAVQVFGYEPSQGLAAADLLGDDGRLDLAAVSPPGGGPGARSTVTILRNTPAGIEPEQVLTLAQSMSIPRSIAAGDLDGQNGLDLAVGSNNTPGANDAETASIFLSDGAGGFDPSIPLSIERPVAVAIGDVDNDGVGELVCSQDFSTNGVTDGSLVFESGGGTPSFTIERGFGASSLAIGNLDNDAAGLNDYAVANTGTNDITVNLWTGSAFATATFNALPGISAITIGRVGDDAVNDIVGVSATGGVIVMEGDPSFGFGTPVPWPAGPAPAGIAGGDFNRDGRYDVMVMNPGADTVSLLLASPQGGFFAPVTISAIETPSAFVTGDFDGDGRADIAVASGASPAIMIIYSNADSL